MTTSVDKFWSRVQTGAKCWLWTGAKTSSTTNYIRGNLTFMGKYDRPHRVAWKLTYGNIPEGLWVLHKCDNPLCVRPDHLYLGTAKLNTNDMISRGRRGDTTMPGEKNRFSKLTEDQVHQIRIRYHRGETSKTLAQDYPVSPGTINKIVRRQKWRHI